MRCNPDTHVTNAWTSHALTTVDISAPPARTNLHALTTKINAANSYADLKQCVDSTLRLLLNPRLAWCLCQEPILSLPRMLAVCIRRMPPPLLPISVGADGNCLPRCASVLVHENPYRDKRTRIILELVLAQEYYLDESFLQVGCQDSNLLAAYSMYSGQILPHPFLQSSARVQSGEERSWR